MNHIKTSNIGAYNSQHHQDIYINRQNSHEVEKNSVLFLPRNAPWTQYQLMLYSGSCFIHQGTGLGRSPAFRPIETVCKFTGSSKRDIKFEANSAARLDCFRHAGLTQYPTCNVSLCFRPVRSCAQNVASQICKTDPNKPTT